MHELFLLDDTEIARVSIGCFLYHLRAVSGHTVAILACTRTLKLNKTLLLFHLHFAIIIITNIYIFLLLILLLLFGTSRQMACAMNAIEYHIMIIII